MPSKPPRLVVLAHASVLDRGGYARRVLDCARTLRRAFEHAAVEVVSVESPTRWRDAAAVEAVRAEARAFGATLSIVPAWPRRRGLRRLSDLLATRAVARHVGDADLVHAHGPRAARTALDAAATRRVRVVVDVHGDRAAEGRLERGEPDDLSTPTDPAEAAVVLEASGVVYASDALSARFPAATGAPSGVVPCLVDEARLLSDAAAEEARTSLRRAWGLSGGEWIAAYAGSLAAWQEVPRVAALVKHLVPRVPQLRLLFLTPDRAAATALLDAAGLPRGTFRVLSPPSDEVVRTLCAADSGLLLRRPCVANAVAFPTKTAEYLAAGLSIVTTDAVLALVSLVARHPAAGISVPWASEDEVLAARLAGATRPSKPLERAARRALARTDLSGAAGVPVYRQVHGTLLGA